MQFIWAVVLVGVAGYFGFLFWQVTHLQRITWRLLRDYDTLGQWLQAGKDQDEHQIYEKLLEAGEMYAEQNGYEPKLSFDEDFRRIMLPGLLRVTDMGLNLVRLRYSMPIVAATIAGLWANATIPIACMLAFILSARFRPIAAGRHALFVHIAAMTYMLQRWHGLDEESCRTFVRETPLFDALYRQMVRLSGEMAAADEG